jgi:prepilin-type N-terminal cleavage/methylation domain
MQQNLPGLPPGGGTPGRSRGFTLVELMITLAVLAIIMAIATPAFTGLVNSNRLTAQSNELVTAFQIARSEAIRRNARVTFCGSTDGASCAAAGNWSQWLVLTATGTVIQAGQVRAPAAISASVPQMVFRADGLARDATGALLASTIDVCLPVSRPANNVRRLTVAAGSRVSISERTTAGVCP